MKPDDVPHEAFRNRSAVDTDAHDEVKVRRAGTVSHAASAVAVGELLAIAGNGTTLLVTHAGSGVSHALHARATIDVHAAHIGSAVVLVFENGDPHCPIVIGVVRGHAAWPLAEPPAQVEVDCDGERMVVEARQELVLRCGKASITLTREGNVLIEGTYVSSRSSGVQRIRGGSIQLN